MPPTWMWATLCAEARLNPNNTISMREGGIVHLTVPSLAEVPEIYLAGQIDFGRLVPPDELIQQQTRILDEEGLEFYQYDSTSFPVSGGMTATNIVHNLGVIPFPSFGRYLVARWVHEEGDSTELTPYVPLEIVQA